MYNKKEIIEAIKKAENINITVARKNMHQTKLYEIKNILEEFSSFNLMFDPEFNNRFLDYKKAIFLKETKKELDRKLYLCKYSILKELNEIIKIIEYCNWDKKANVYRNKLNQKLLNN